MTRNLAEVLQQQCSEFRKDCLDANAALFIWLRMLRNIRVVLLIMPIICGAFASWSILKEKPQFATLTALLALIAGLIPAVYSALKLDEQLPKTARIQGEFRILEITFGELQNIGPAMEPDAFMKEYKDARVRLEKVHAESYTVPEWCFRRARKLIKSGHWIVGNDK